MATDDFVNDVISILVAAGIADEDIFVGAKANIPTSDGPFITIKETGGAGPLGTHNSTDVPAYIRPSAQIVARGEDYAKARAMAQVAWDALFKIRNRKVNGTWYVSITMNQQPFDLGEDDSARPRIAFNISSEKRFSSATS